MGNQSVLYFRGKGLTVTGFKFVGRGIFMDSPNGQMIDAMRIEPAGPNVVQIVGWENNRVFCDGMDG